MGSALSGFSPKNALKKLRTLPFSCYIYLGSIIHIQTNVPHSAGEYKYRLLTPVDIYDTKGYALS